jgi:hypothetical protein
LAAPSPLSDHGSYDAHVSVTSPAVAAMQRAAAAKMDFKVFMIMWLLFFLMSCKNNVFVPNSQEMIIFETWNIYQNSDTTK